MDKACEDIQKLLVDYADGGLSPGQSGEVTSHLEQCENCRELLGALQKSLGLAEVVWADGLAETEAVEIPVQPKIRNIHWLRYAAVAASIFIVVATSLLLRGVNRPKEPVLSFEEIEKQVNDSANAARLLAATELLAEYPDSKEIVEQQYRYIVRAYPDTLTAEKIRLKIQ